MLRGTKGEKRCYENQNANPEIPQDKATINKSASQN